ncbi:MAG: tetratricopeptide repeat protein [Chloroflexota bacterium]
MGNLIGNIAFGIIATFFMGRSFQAWQTSRETEGNLVTRWLWALVLATIGSQILFWIPLVRFAGFDWYILFRDVWLSSRTWYSNLYYLSLGLLLFFLLRFVLAGGLYLLLIRVLHLQKPRFWIRWLLFLGSYFGIEFLTQWIMSMLRLSYWAGLDNFAIGFLQPQNGMFGLITLLLAALTINAIRSERETIATTSWEAWLPALFVANLAYGSTRNGWMAILAFGFLATWAGQRLPRVVQLPRRISRFLFWFLLDLPTLAIVIGSWVLWQKGWLTFILAVISIVILSFGIMSGILMRVFPIAGRQEWIMLIQQNPAQKTILEEMKREVTRLEKEDLRKRVLRKLRKQEQQLGTAETERLAGKFDKALRLLDGIINSLSQITSLIAAQKECLGKAYQSRAKIYVAQGSLDAAHTDVKKAQQYLQPDLELIGGIADLASSRNYNQSVTFKYCLDYLAMMRGKPADSRFHRIQAYLEKFCQIGATKSSEQAIRVQQIASQVIAVDPNSAWAYRVQGQAGIVLEQWDQALGSLETAVRLSPRDKASQFALGQIYQHQGRQLEARRAYEESLRIDKTQADVAHALGCLLLDAFGKEELKLAFDLLEQAAKDTPKNAVYQYGWGRACIAMGNWKSARTAFERALKLDESSTPTRRALANLLYQQREWQAALPHYEILHEKNAADSAYQICLGRCLLETGSAERAVRLVAAQAADGDTQSLFVVGRAHLRLGQYDQAVEELRKLVNLQKQNGKALYYLGCAYAWLGGTKNPSYFKNALQSFERAEEADDSLSARASLQLGHIYLRQDRVEEAVRCYRRAAESTELELSAGLALARAFMADGQMDNADRELNKLRKHKSAEVQYIAGLAAEMREDLKEAEKAYRQTGSNGSLGVILYKQKKTLEARSALQQARYNGENSDRVLYYSGLCHIEAGDFERGIGEWDLLAMRHPDSGLMRMNLDRASYLWGCELYRQNKYKEAAKAWEPLANSGGTNEDLKDALQQLYVLAAYHENEGAEKKRLLQRASELSAEQWLTDTVLALGHLTNGDLNGAFTTLTRLIKQDPDNEVLNYNLGVVSLALGKGRESVEKFICAQNSGNSQLNQLGTWGVVAALGSTGQWKEAAKALSGSLE